jgi:hypothetical protein
LSGNWRERVKVVVEERSDSKLIYIRAYVYESIVGASFRGNCSFTKIVVQGAVRRFVGVRHNCGGDCGILKRPPFAVEPVGSIRARYFREPTLKLPSIGIV